MSKVDDTTPSSDDAVAVVDLADELQVRKQTIFKVIKRLGIPSTSRRDSSRGNQKIATITLADAALLRTELSRVRFRPADAAETLEEGAGLLADEPGVFYLIQLEPEHDPGRFKLGFTTEIEGRLRKHRCAAPFARTMKTWPCRRTWERAAIDCAAHGCEKLHTEVFRATSLADVVARADAFFALMPM